MKQDKTEKVGMKKVFLFIILIPWKIVQLIIGGIKHLWFGVYTIIYVAYSLFENIFLNLSLSSAESHRQRMKEKLEIEIEKEKARVAQLEKEKAKQRFEESLSSLSDNGIELEVTSKPQTADDSNLASGIDKKEEDGIKINASVNTSIEDAPSKSDESLHSSNNIDTPKTQINTLGTAPALMGIPIPETEAIGESKKQKRTTADLYKDNTYNGDNYRVIDSVESLNGTGMENMAESMSNYMVASDMPVELDADLQDSKYKPLQINYEGKDAIKSDKKVLFQYIAKNPEGKIVKDYFEAYSKVEVHSFLLSEGYEVYSIKSSKWITFLHGKSSVNKTKIKTKDLIFFTTQLSTYIKSGITLAESLKILARQFRKAAYKKIFQNIVYDLTMGDSFSTTLAKQGVAFPKLFINMMKTAEMTGELPEALDDMSDYYTEVDRTRKQMVTALMYPTMVLIFAIAVIVFILVWVIPQFVAIYESMDASKIPAFTLFVMNVSDFLKHYGIFLLLGIVVFILIIIYLYKNIKSIRTSMQWVAMHIPVIGNVIIYNEVTMFTKTFASLLKHNVFITDSMDILKKMTNNEVYRTLILETMDNIAHGDKISMAFQDHWAFPIPAYEMLVTGEKTGQLPDMMAKVSTYYQELHAQSVARIKTFVEPILIIFLTVIVGIIILAIVLPMFGMYDMIQ